MAEKAFESFAKTRNLSPDNEHGYIADAHLMIKLLYYAARDYKNVIEYLMSPGIPMLFQGGLAHIEDLLERVRRDKHDSGGSTFEQNLRASLDNMYGNHSRALEIWGNLIGRPDVFNPSIRRQMVWTYLARVKRDWAQLSQDEIEKISRLLEDNLHEDPNNERDLRLWIQLVRWLKLTREVSAERVIEKISYWKIQSDSLESTYYLMILHGLLAFQGSPGHREKHNAFKLECKRRAQYFANRTRSYEWLGAGLRLGQLINHSRLEGWDNATQFWTNTELLIRIPGVISKIDSPQAGFLEIGGGLEAFFVPSKANVTRSADENKRVTCFIGFSFDGLRAWEVELV